MCLYDCSLVCLLVWWWWCWQGTYDGIYNFPEAEYNKALGAAQGQYGGTNDEDELEAEDEEEEELEDEEEGDEREFVEVRCRSCAAAWPLRGMHVFLF